MDQTKTYAQDVRGTDSGDTSFLDVMIAFAKRKRIIVGLPLAAALLAAAASLMLPDVYRAETKLLPPQQAQSNAAALLSQLSGMGAAASVAGIKSPNELYVGMLRSRTIADRLIARFDLLKVYGVKSQEAARKSLESNTSINSGKDGLISIDVQGEQQKLVAPLANAYAEELLRLTRSLAITDASQRRMFFESQLELSKNNLAKAEIALKAALDTSGMVSVDTESQTLVETLARVRAQVTAKEIQLNSMRPFLTASHPDFKRVSEELNSLRQQLSTLENGRSGETALAKTAGTTRSGLGNIQLLRDVKYYQMLYDLLAKQFEVARLDEAKDPTLIQVLDHAIEPERKFKPRRALLVVICTTLALFAAFLFAFFLDFRQRALRSPDTARRWEELKTLIRSR